MAEKWYFQTDTLNHEIEGGFAGCIRPVSSTKQFPSFFFLPSIRLFIHLLRIEDYTKKIAVSNSIFIFLIFFDIYCNYLSLKFRLPQVTDLWINTSHRNQSDILGMVAFIDNWNVTNSDSESKALDDMSRTVCILFSSLVLKETFLFFL